jgi:hypothetical protein
MRLFPITTPTLALSVSEQALCLVEIKKQWRTSQLQNLTRVPLPQGVLKLSSAKLNIERPEEFLTHFKSLVEPYSRPLSIVLSLPDLCARTSVFDFSTFPTKKHEQTALVKWRFQQDLKLDTSQSRLAYGAYMPASVRDFPSPDQAETVRVLGSAIRHEIVEQYEKMCLDAHLLPTAVGLSGLDVFDFYRSQIQERLQADVHASESLSSGAMFLFISHWGFTFLSFQDGTPCFIRTKAISIKEVAEIDEKLEAPDTGRLTAGNRETTDPVDPLSKDPYPSYTTMKVGKEILATLQYYLEAFPLRESSSSAVHLFVATDLAHGHRLIPSTEHIQRTLKVSGGPEPQITITSLSHASHFHLKKAPLAFHDREEAALPGYASLMVA